MESTYSYQVFENDFELTVSCNGETVKALKSSFNDIESMEQLENTILMQLAGQKYILRKAALAPDSAFFKACEEKNDKPKLQAPRGLLRVYSIVLFALSIAALFAALFTLATVSESEGAGIEDIWAKNMWVFFLYIPIPIASLLLGFYLKKNGYAYKKNVIIGIAMTAALCVYGSFSFIFS